MSKFNDYINMANSYLFNEEEKTISQSGSFVAGSNTKQKMTEAPTNNDGKNTLTGIFSKPTNQIPPKSLGQAPAKPNTAKPVDNNQSVNSEAVLFSKVKKLLLRKVSNPKIAFSLREKLMIREAIMFNNDKKFGDGFVFDSIADEMVRNIDAPILAEKSLNSTQKVQFFINSISKKGKDRNVEYEIYTYIFKARL